MTYVYGTSPRNERLRDRLFRNVDTIAMIATLSRYWIALLVIVLVGLHASIMALVRYQAIQAQQLTSCEIDLGNYTVFKSSSSTESHSPEKGFVQLRVHAVVPHEYRVQGQRTFESHHWELKQSIEELMRQIDPELLQDPSLTDLKKQVLDILVQSVGESLVNRILVTEMTASPGSVLVFSRVAPKKDDHHSDDHHSHAGNSTEHAEHASAGNHGGSH